MGVGLILPGAGGGGGGGAPASATAVATMPLPDNDEEELLLDGVVRPDIQFAPAIPWEFDDPDSLVSDEAGNYYLADAPVGLYVLTFSFGAEPIDALSQYGLSARLGLEDEASETVAEAEGYFFHHQDIAAVLSVTYWLPTAQSLRVFASLDYNAGTGDGWSAYGVVTVQRITWS